MEFNTNKIAFLFERILAKFNFEKIHSIEDLNEYCKKQGRQSKYFGMGKNDPFSLKIPKTKLRIGKSLKLNMLKNLDVLNLILTPEHDYYGDDEFKAFQLNSSYNKLIREKDEKEIERFQDILKSHEIDSEDKSDILINLKNIDIKEAIYRLRQFNLTHLEKIYRGLSAINPVITGGIDDYYANIYLTYVELGDPEDFNKQYLIYSGNNDLPKKPNVDTSKIDSEKADVSQVVTKEFKDYSRFTKYIGFYFSIVTNNIKKFTLGIDYKKGERDPKTDILRFPTVQFGLHENEKYCEGYSFVYPTSIHVELEYMDSEARQKGKTKIILVTGENPPKDKYFFTGTILSYSSTQDIPVAVEALFLSQKSKNRSTGQLKIKRHLFICQSSFATQNKIDKLQRLFAKGINVDYLSHLPGLWRIWRFDVDWNIVTAFLHVRDDYRTTCFTIYENEIREQFCSIDIVKSETKVVSFSAREGSSMSRQFMIRYPKKNENNTEGIFMYYPREQNSHLQLCMRGMALRRELDEIRNTFFYQKGKMKGIRIKNKKTNDIFKLQFELFKDQRSLDEMLHQNPRYSELFYKLIEINLSNKIFPPLKKWNWPDRKCEE